MRKIIYYGLENNIIEEKNITQTRLSKLNGMKIICRLNNGEEIIGFCDPYLTFESQNFDGSMHQEIIICDGSESELQIIKVKISDIEQIVTIKYENNPRWWFKLTRQYTMTKKDTRN